MRSLALVLLVALGCVKRPVLYVFEPPPVGAAYTRRDVTIHHDLSETLIACQRELDRRYDDDRSEAWRRRLRLYLASLIAGMGQRLAGSSSLESDVPCDPGRANEARCISAPGFVLLHVGPTVSTDGNLEDLPRSGLDLRQDIDAALRRVDELLERPELEIDRDATLAAIDGLRRECTPSPLPGDPAPATLAP